MHLVRIVNMNSKVISTYNANPPGETNRLIRLKAALPGLNGSMGCFRYLLQVLAAGFHFISSHIFLQIEFGTSEPNHIMGVAASQHW